MTSKIAFDERAGFADRLNEALSKAGIGTLTVPQLMHEFNLRADGARVTQGAVRKWLSGEAIPTQEKVRVLAKWTGVSAEWLRFGDDTASTQFAEKLAADSKALTAADRRFLTDLHALSQIGQALMRAILDAVMLSEQQRRR